MGYSNCRKRSHDCGVPIFVYILPCSMRSLPVTPSAKAKVPSLPSHHCEMCHPHYIMWPPPSSLPPSSSSRAGCPSPVTRPVRALRCEPAACRRHPALASRWRGACGPTPGAGISGQGSMGWADAVGGKGRLIFLSPGGRWQRPCEFPILLALESGDAFCRHAERSWGVR